MQSLIAAYRYVGSRWADLDPLKRTERPKIPELEPAFYDLTEPTWTSVFNTSNTFFGKASTMSLREIMQRAARNLLRHRSAPSTCTCTDQDEKRWWQQRLETIRSKPNFTRRARRSTSSTG